MLVIIAAVVQMMIVSIRAEARIDTRIDGTSVAVSQIEQARTLSFTRLTGLLGQSVVEVPAGDPQFRVTRDVYWVEVASEADACQRTASGTLDVLRVDISVAPMGDLDNVVAAQSTTVAPPGGTTDPNKGAMSVRVSDANVQPVKGAWVEIDGPGGIRSGLTTSDGCIVFTGLEPDNYDVSASKRDHVDPQLNEVVSRSDMPVSAGLRSDVDLLLSPSGQLELSFGTVSGLGAIPLEIGASIERGGQIYSVENPPFSFPLAQTYRFEGLYPGGYASWGGSCQDADPQSTDSGGEPYWPDAERTSPAIVLGGEASTVTTLLAHRRVYLDVPANSLTGKDVTGARAEHLGPAVSCDVTYTYGPLGEVGTDIDGLHFVDLAIPLGQYDVDVVLEDGTVFRVFGATIADFTSDKLVADEAGGATS